jgi:hypothetical protein
MDDFQAFAQTGSNQQTSNSMTIHAVLCWSEYYNGKWQPTKTSDVSRPTQLGGFFDADGFDLNRNLLQIVPMNVALINLGIDWYALQFTYFWVISNLPADALVLGIVSPQGVLSHSVGSGGGFVAYNTHSLPVRWEDIALPEFSLLGTGYSDEARLSELVLPPPSGRSFKPAGPYSGGGGSSFTFNVAYWSLAPPWLAPPQQVADYSSDVLVSTIQQRIADGAPTPAGWDAPFFYEDRRNLFYVTTTESTDLVLQYNGYGFGTVNAGYRFAAPSPQIPTLVLDAAPPMRKPTPLAAGVASIGSGPEAVRGLIHQGGNIKVGLGIGSSVSYQGAPIYPTGASNTKPVGEPVIPKKA